MAWEVDKIPTGPGLVKRHGRLDVNTGSPTFEETVAAHAPKAHAASHGAAGSDPVTVAQSQVTNLTTDLAAKAPLASPTFTGTPAAPTAALGTNTTQVATTAFVKGAVDALVASAPGALDTLDELAAALGDDANFAGTVTTALAGKAPIASPTFTGQVAVPLGTAGAPSITPTGDPNTGIYSPGADQVGIATAGTARVYVGSTGNVGIGTTSPSGTLHIVGSTTWNQRYGNAFALYISRRNGDSSTPTDIGANETIGDFYNLGYVNGNDRQFTLIRTSADGTPSSTSYASRLRFFTVPTGSTTVTERMQIDNAGLITGTGTSLGAWTSYTPTLGGTGWAIGNGTATGAYCQIGKIIHFRAQIQSGSTSTYGTASPTLTLPVTASGSIGAGQGQMSGRFFDTSTSTFYQAAAHYSSTTTVSVRVIGTNGIHNTTNSTSPFTWATGDRIIVTGTYEAA